MGIAWEAKFSATLALLRSVGHVLDKVDGEVSPAARTEIDRWWDLIFAHSAKAGRYQARAGHFLGLHRRRAHSDKGQLRAGQSAMLELVWVQHIRSTRTTQTIT
jgi:hypothetical protein